MMATAALLSMMMMLRMAVVAVAILMMMATAATATATRACRRNILGIVGVEPQTILIVGLRCHGDVFAASTSTKSQAEILDQVEVRWYFCLFGKCNLRFNT